MRDPRHDDLIVLASNEGPKPSRDEINDIRIGRVMKTARITLVAAAIGSLLLSVIPMSAAQAADTPTTEELLALCATADYCKFTPTSNEPFVSDPEQVSPVAPNCDPYIVDLWSNWSQTKGSSDSVGGSVTASASAFGVFTTAFEINYSHEWTSSNTTGNSLTLHVPQGNIGYVTRAAAMNRVTGTYELHFGDRFHGHYYWYTAPVTIEGPDTTRPSSEVVQPHNRPMTDSERAQFCS